MPGRAIELYEKAAESAKAIRDTISEEELPTEGILDVYYREDEDKIRLNVGDWVEPEVQEQWEDALSGCCSEMEVMDEAGKPGDPNYVRVYFKPTLGKNAALCQPSVKQAYSPFLRNVGQTLQMFPSEMSKYIPGSPSPVASMVAGGLLGAGLGYGGGWLAEKVLPEKWKRGNLRRTLAILGGLAGTVPGGVWGFTNKAIGNNFNDPSLLNMPPEPNIPPMPNPYEGINADLATKLKRTPAEPYKEASALPTGFAFSPYEDMPAQSYIPVEETTRTLAHDPRVAQRLAAPVQAITNAVVQGASHINNGARFITPMDMGKVTLGMGSGYLSGLVVGKVLGALTGMPETAQNRLKNTGMWAGALANVAPMMFPRS